MEIKKFVNDTYGSGSGLTLVYAIIIMLVTTTISLSMFLHIDLNTISNGLPTLMNKMFFHYIELIIFCAGLLFLSLHLYCKPIPKIDRFKRIKIIFAFLTLSLFGILLFPYAASIFILSWSGEILKIDKLQSDIVKTPLKIAAWVMSFILIFALSFKLGYFIKFRLIINFPIIYNAIGEKTVIYYSTFISMLLSNKIAKLVFFKISKIENQEFKKQVNHQMTLLWYYITFLISFIVKPLDFNITFIKLFSDAIFYSSATIGLLSKAMEWRNKAE